MERNWLGDGCLEPENKGLTHFGMQVVRECNRLGILIDCSHVGQQTTLDAIRHSEKPVVILHTAIRAITENPRCVTDEQMKAVADKGGAIGITTFSPFIRTDRQPSLDDYLIILTTRSISSATITSPSPPTGSMARPRPTGRHLGTTRRSRKGRNSADWAWWRPRFCLSNAPPQRLSNFSKRVT
jgi:hypothetical protein